MEYYSVNKKERTADTCNNMDQSLRYEIEVSQAQMSEYILYDSCYMKFQNPQK